MNPTPCPGCGRDVLPVYSAATSRGLVLETRIDPVVQGEKGPTVGDGNAGYRTYPDGSAAVACAPGPQGWAGAGETRQPHRCGRSGIPEVVHVRRGDQADAHPCTEAAANVLLRLQAGPDAHRGLTPDRLRDAGLHVYDVTLTVGEKAAANGR